MPFDTELVIDIIYSFTKQLFGLVYCTYTHCAMCLYTVRIQMVRTNKWCQVNSAECRIVDIAKLKWFVLYLQWFLLSFWGFIYVFGG